MLLDSLADGNVKLSQAHLIVISDAQRVMPMHIPHPVMRIMTEFYAKVLDGPQVLATVTSAPDRWTSLDLTPLEISFRARSFFLATKAADSWFAPLELVVEYDAYSPTAADSAIASKLQEADPHGLFLRPRHFRRTRRLLHELGHLPYNLAWKHILGGVITSSPSSGEEAAVQQRLSDLRKGWPDENLVAIPGYSACNISPKFATMLRILSAYTDYAKHFRGVVVVKDRMVAEYMVQILRMPEVGLPFVRAAVVPHGTVNHANQQLALYHAFDQGTSNLLVLTRSLEEIELPPASAVICYDLFEDQLAYAYAHAHSRGRHGHLIHLVERGNNEQRRILSRVETIDTDLRSWIASVAKGDYKIMPPKSLYVGSDTCLSDSDEEDGEHQEFILDPTTSARLHKADAEASIYRLVASFEPHTALSQRSTSISLEQQTENGLEEGYRYVISLPMDVGVPAVVGPFCSTKVQARREAFFRACQECVRAGLMDYRHFPQPRRHLGELSLQGSEKSSDLPRDVKTANTSSATHGYPRKSPNFWANSPKYPMSTLYPTVIVPDNLAGQPHAPVALLTRAPLPPIPDFLLYFSGARASARFYKGAPFGVNSAQLQALRGYTTRVVRSLTNKPFDCSAENLLHFFAPLNPSWQPLSGTQGLRWSQLPVREYIPWDAVQLAADYFAVPLYSNLTSLDDSARDAIVQDRNVEFTMRHFLVKVRHDLTPLSKAEDSPREAEYANFLEYCKARRKDFSGLEDEQQPMIEVTAVPGIINNLHPMSTPPTPPAKTPLKYLVPELTYKFTIPASTFRTLWLLPSIMTKIDSYLLVKELDAKLFRLTISEQQLLVALSTRAAWTDDNYERLEFLGDVFLKVIASNFLYVTMPAAGEGTMHHARQGIIGNKILHECAMRVGICPYVQHKRFVPKLWLPAHRSSHAPTGAAAQSTVADEGDGGAEDEDVEMGGGEAAEDSGNGKQRRSKKQRQLDSQNTLWMGDKVVADVVEAILGAAFLSGGHEVALRAARQLQIPLPNVAQWTDFARIGAAQQQHQQLVGGAALEPSVTALHPATIEAVQAIVGSTFSKPTLLAQALTHGSAFGGTEGASYERLEFIGDAILDFLVARHIFAKHPHLSPGGLTLLKGAMVSNRALAAFCVHAGLHRHLALGSDQLAGAIAKYVDFLDELRRKEYDFAAREGRLPGQYWLDMPIEPPKCLSDVVESVIGALYVCDGLFEVGVGRFFDAVFKPFMDAHVRLQTLSTNPKVTLLELLQAEGCQQHAVIKKPQPRPNMPVEMEVHVHGQVIASATDPSATIATRKVSLAALDALSSDPELLARLCDCGLSDSRKQPPKQDAMQEDEVEAAEVEEAMEAIDDTEQ
ncbi:ribonuclease III [Trametes punicea]|nr:ribonuclease III [Trametes punicea]